MRGSWGIFLSIALLMIWNPKGCVGTQGRTLSEATIDYVDRLHR